MVQLSLQQSKTKNMKKHFFSHLVEVSEIHIELDSHPLEDHEKDEVKKIIDESIYHTVLDAILSELSEEDKKAFLSHVVDDDHEKIWEFVNNKVENIEDKIVKAADDIKAKIHSDIKDAK